MHTAAIRQIFTLFFTVLFHISFIIPIEATSQPDKVCEKQGDFKYVSLQEVMAGQTLMSQELIGGIAGDLRKPGFYKEEGTNQIKLCYDNGKSPFNKPFKVLAAPPGIKDESGKVFTYVLIDGHHTIGGTLLAIKKAGMGENDLRNIALPVQIDEQYKNLSLEKFWQTIREHHLVYAEKETGNLAPRHLLDVPNDDMRSFIESTVVGCSESKSIKYNNAQNKTLWLRVGGEKVHASVPFIEFYIADALREKGFSYKTGDPITPEKVEQARKNLLANPTLLNQKHVLVIEPSNGKLIVHGSQMTPEMYCQNFIGSPSTPNVSAAAPIPQAPSTPNAPPIQPTRPSSTAKFTVEAGPLWRQADAQQKCPSVCSAKNSKWDGQWWTTRPGKMSVCECVPKT